MATVYDLQFEQLSDRLVGWGEPAFRARQVWTQLWKRAATYEQMSDVSPALRERLAKALPLGVEVLTERTADRGATRKALLRLGGQHVIETVLMGYPDRVTVCVSSQSGCAMGCTFCATGQMGLKNNLTAGEIAAQVVWARREAAKLPDTTPQRLTNVVFMGMGEPIGGYLRPRFHEHVGLALDHDLSDVRENPSCRRPVVPASHGRRYPFHRLAPVALSSNRQCELQSRS
jgi:23S rRNA (adenine2503-C2)-methyltransferase